MVKRSLLKLLVYLALSCAGQTFAVESDELLQPDDAFQFSAKVNKADPLLLSWDIANGYYLYRHKIKVVSLTDGIKVSEPFFPASQTKHDKFFGEVDIYRDHLEIEILLKRQEPTQNKLMLEVTFQGCAEVGVCYMPIQKTLSLDLSDENLVVPHVDIHGRAGYEIHS